MCLSIFLQNTGYYTKPEANGFAHMTDHSTSLFQVHIFQACITSGKLSLEMHYVNITSFAFPSQNHIKIALNELLLTYIG